LDKKIIVVIPARGGSKGIPRKNIRLMNGQPLISYVIRNAKQSKYVDKIIVSTDDEEIATISARYGAEIIMRTPELSSDAIPLDPVVYDVITRLEKENYKAEYVATIQPTSPLLSTKTINAAIEKIINDKLDTVLTASDDRHLSWTKEDGRYIPKYEKRVNRQYLPKEYRETGGILISRRDVISEHSRIGAKIQLFEVPKDESIDIDSDMDWWVAEKLLKKRRIVIRVDGYKEIGLGHVYRGLSLASRIIDHEVIFLMDRRYQLGIDIVKSYNYRVVEFEGDQIEAINSLSPHILINDILNTEYGFIEKLKEQGIFTVNFEDMGEGAEIADIVINALYDDGLPYSNHYYGKDYYCLKEEFYSIPPKGVNRKVSNILVTFGGTDPNNFTKKILNVLKDIPGEFSINVVAGMGYSHIEEIVELSKNIDKEVGVYNNIKSMSEFMRKADLIFSSAGRTMYEIASIGVPAIILCQNDRELMHIFGGSENGFINLGLGVNVSDNKIKRITEDLIENFPLREDMINKMKSIDLKAGADRVLNIIFDNYFKAQEEKS